MDIKKIDDLRPLQFVSMNIANGQNITGVTVGVPAEVVAKLTECILSQSRTINSLLDQIDKLNKQLKNK